MSGEGSASAWAEYIGTTYSGPIHLSAAPLPGDVRDDVRRDGEGRLGESLCRRCLWLTGGIGPRRR